MEASFPESEIKLTDFTEQGALLPLTAATHFGAGASSGSFASGLAARLKGKEPPDILFVDTLVNDSGELVGVFDATFENNRKASKGRQPTVSDAEMQVLWRTHLLLATQCPLLLNSACYC